MGFNKLNFINYFLPMFNPNNNSIKQFLNNSEIWGYRACKPLKIMMNTSSFYSNNT
jgi:hypothetical protein